MIRTSTVRRYCQPLFELATEQNKRDIIAGQLRSVLNTIESSDELKRFLENPTVKAQKKIAAFTELGKLLELDNLCANFIDVLIRRGRLDHLAAIIDEFEKMDRDARGVVVVKVTTARGLKGGAGRNLTQKLKATLGKQIELETAEDSELIGGAVAEIGGTVFDGSVKRQLALLQQRLGEE